MTDNSDEKSDPTGVDEYVTVIELFALLDPVSDEDADDGSVIASKTNPNLESNNSNNSDKSKAYQCRGIPPLTP